jgi:hypothetical protein
MKTLKVDQVAHGLDTTVVPATQVFMYRVTQVTNSIQPHVLDHLTPEELDPYCQDEEWEVTIR